MGGKGSRHRDEEEADGRTSRRSRPTSWMPSTDARRAASTVTAVARRSSATSGRSAVRMTDADGRIRRLLDGPLTPASIGIEFSTQWIILQYVAITFRVDDVTRSYHVPLLLAPVLADHLSRQLIAAADGRPCATVRRRATLRRPGVRRESSRWPGRAARRAAEQIASTAARGRADRADRRSSAHRRRPGDDLETLCPQSRATTPRPGHDDGLPGATRHGSTTPTRHTSGFGSSSSSPADPALRSPTARWQPLEARSVEWSSSRALTDVFAIARDRLTR